MGVPLLFNPAAGGGKGERRARRAAELLAARGIATELRSTREALPLAEPRVLVLGGDGTHGEVVDALLAAGHAGEVGLLPGGTGNDLLLHFGVRTLEQAVEGVATGQPRAIDVGHARWEGGERRFLSMFGTGFLADVTAYANERLKGLGSWSYVAAVPPVLGRLRALPTRLRLDGRVVEGTFSLVAVCNTSRAGGGLRIAPDAVADDGALDVLALAGHSRARVLALLPRLARGTHVGARDVLSWRASHVEIEPVDPQRLLLDGETLGSTPVRVRVLPRALRLLLPSSDLG